MGALKIKNYEYWEMSRLLELQEYLLNNCRTLHTPMAIEDIEEIVGESTRYDFDAGLSVETFLIENEGLTIVVSGTNQVSADLFSDKLKRIVTGGTPFPDWRGYS